jgi:hypothetical protein
MSRGVLSQHHYDSAAHKMLEDPMSELATAVYDVEKAVERVEAAIKDKWSTAQWIGIILVSVTMWSLPGQIWHAKWRYAAAYGVASTDVHAETKPHDCNFLAAPLGNKYCHYDPVAMITRWATSQAGAPIVSYDDGKTWSAYTPDTGENVPTFSTVKAIFIGWEKKED